MYALLLILGNYVSYLWLIFGMEELTFVEIHFLSMTSSVIDTSKPETMLRFG